MTKLSIDYLDALVKGAADIPDNGRGQVENPNQTGENSSKPPALREPIDKAMGVAGAAVAGVAGLAGGLAKIKTTLPMKEIQ